MGRPVTLFTGQWADLPLETLVQKAKDVGLRRPGAGLLGRPLRGRQAPWSPTPTCARGASCSRPTACRLLRDQHAPRRPGGRRDDHRRAPPGDPAAARSGATATPRASASAPPRRSRRRRAPRRSFGVKVVNGFTGSPIWHVLAMFPPVPPKMIEAGYAEFADRWNPILDVFDEAGVKFRARGPSLGDRLRLLDDQARARGDRQPTRRSASTSTRATSTGRCVDPVDFVYEIRRPDLPHAREGVDPEPQRAQRHPRARTSSSATTAAAGTSSRRAAAACRSSGSSGRSTTSATRAPTRSSGKTTA